MALVVVELIKEKLVMEEEALTMMPTLVVVGEMALVIPEGNSQVCPKPAPDCIHTPLITKQPVERLMPLVKVEVPDPPTFMTPVVCITPATVVAIPTPSPLVM